MHLIGRVMFQQRIAQEGVIEVFTVAVRFVELAGYIGIFAFRFNDGDGLQANEQHVIGKACFTRFICTRRPFGYRFVDAGFRASAFGKAQRFTVGLPARFTQLGIDREAALFFAEIQRAFDRLIGDLFMIGLTFLFGLLRQFGIFAASCASSAARRALV